jgi:trk system potassium uptake protein TrkH
MMNFSHIPLFLRTMVIFSLAMWLPAAVAVSYQEFYQARSFFYSGLIGLLFTGMLILAMSNRLRPETGYRQMGTVLAVFCLMPIFLGLPFYEAGLGIDIEITYVDAVFEMTSAITTTGLPIFDALDLGPILNLWRGIVAWLGGLIVWVAALAIFAPLNIGGFEVARSYGSFADSTASFSTSSTERKRPFARALEQVFPIYIGMTLVLWVSLFMVGQSSLDALIHAMSTLSTSGISSNTTYLSASGGGRAAEILVFLFLFFAISRATFIRSKSSTSLRSLKDDPEMRIAISIVLFLALALTLRHLVASDTSEAFPWRDAFHSFWGGLFTALSFLTTTGFVSVDWHAAQAWSGIETSGVIFLGLALIGGGIATTAGGVKLLRIFALYISGLREMERMVHPSALPLSGSMRSQIRQRGLTLAWVFFMLFAISIALVSLILAATGMSFDQAMTLSVATLSTTGPLATIASEEPIFFIGLGSIAKITLGLTMILGRLEVLVIIALLSPSGWRNW